MKRHSIIFLLILGLAACSKEATHSVRIHIVNNTTVPATDAKLGGEAYGTILPGQTSDYHSFSDLTYTPTLTFNTDTTLVSLLIGYCGTGLPSSGPDYIDNGNYLYTINVDTTAYYGFTYSFTKENK